MLNYKQTGSGSIQLTFVDAQGDGNLLLYTEEMEDLKTKSTTEECK